MSFIEELKRRNVVRVGIAYVVGAWLLVQGADLIFDLIGADDWVLRALASVLALGFIPAVLFAWAFEITPEGIKKEKDVDRTKSITTHTAKKLDIATMILLMAAIGLLALDRFTTPNAVNPAQAGIQPTSDSKNTGSAADTAIRSIAVLPFVDMSPAKDNEYFTDGLTEELLNILAQIKSLQVAGRTSSFAFKGKTEDLREIGEKLNVNTLLEGSVRKDDKSQKIRVTVQLINVEDGYHIWSDTYDRDLEDIFAIQEDIATQVADALKVNLLGEEAAPIATHDRTDLNAYDLYLQGLQKLNTFSFESLPQARSLFEEALLLDPDYQPARQGLALSMLEMSETGAMPQPQAIQLVSPLLDTLLANDPDNSIAHTYRGRILEFQRNYKGADESFQRALQLNSRNAYTLTTYGRFLFDRGEIDEGLGYLQQAQQIEPYDIKLQWNLCAAFGRLSDDENTTKECGRIGDIEADNPMQYYGMMYLHEYRGELAEAMVWREKSIRVDPDDPELTGGVAITWANLGDSRQAERWAEKTYAIDPDHPSSVITRITIMMLKEQREQALAVAQKAFDEQLPDRHGSNFYIYKLLASDAVRKRNFATALQVLMALLPEDLESPLESNDVNDVELISKVATVIKYQDAGSDQIAALLNHAEQLNQQSDGRVFQFLKPYRQATIEAARGNKGEAIMQLEEAVSKGWRFDWRETMQDDFQFESLHKEPAFQELVAFLEADMEKQREEAYQVLEIDR
jgi:TolB-like protein/Tfp pilus assembly protein PilF